MRISDWSSDVCSSDLLIGSAFATKAVWQIMRDQNYGRVLMTTSSAGLGGNFGQANYAAAKAGVIGLARTLRMEGAKHDIRVNCLAPTPGTRMTADIFPEDAYRTFAPENRSEEHTSAL